MINKEIKFVSNRKFGIEFEFNSPDRSTLKDALITVGENCYIDSYCHNINNNRWCAKIDCSCGYELASRVCNGWRDIAVVGNVVEKLHEIRARFNNQCGMHVHVNVSDFSEEQVEILTAYWIKAEHILFAMLPQNRRNNHYCSMANRVCRFGDNVNNYDLNALYSSCRSIRGALNLGNVCFGSSSSRIEFRLGTMSTDSEYVKAWIRLLMHLVDTCKNMPKPVDLKWFSVKNFMRFLGLTNNHKDIVNITYSDSMLSIKKLIVEQIRRYASLNYTKTNANLEEIEVTA